MRPVVLVTGFGPLIAGGVNPSEHVAHQIAATSDLAPLFDALAPLPTVLADGAEIVLLRLSAQRPSAILALGLATATPHVRIERHAHNAIDGKGAIIEGGPGRIATGVHVASLAHALTRHAIPWTYSDDAGGTLSNDFYYRLLALTDVPTVFVHLPRNAHASAKLSRALAEGMAAAVAVAR